MIIKNVAFIFDILTAHYLDLKLSKQFSILNRQTAVAGLL